VLLRSSLCRDDSLDLDIMVMANQTGIMMILAKLARPCTGEMFMRVRANGHYPADDNGKPFFRLADTARMLFYEPGREEAAEYIIYAR